MLDNDKSPQRSTCMWKTEKTLKRVLGEHARKFYIFVYLIFWLFLSPLEKP